MSFAAVLTLIFAQLAGGAAADDHLVPDGGLLSSREVSSYDIALAHAFFPGGADEPRYAQFVVLSSGPAPERAVFIRAVDAMTLEVESIQFKTKLWGDIMNALMPPGDNPQVRVDEPAIAAALAKIRVSPERRRAPIDPATAQALVDVWNLAIDGVRYTRRQPLNDGISYLFADPTHQPRSGWALTPPEHTRMASLVSLGDTLFAYGWEPVDREKRAKQMRADALRLKAMLRARH